MKKLLLITALVPLLALANLCDDIHDLGNRWHKLANAIHDRHDEHLSAADHKRVAKEDRALIPPSRDLVAICRKEDAKVKALGNQLAGLLDEYAAIDSNDSWDEDVAVIDRMVEVLDKLTGICDDHH